MIKSFLQFINESSEIKEMFIKNITTKLFQKIKEFKLEETSSYFQISGISFTEPFFFDLLVEIRYDSNFKTEDDSHFKNLPWEKLNYQKNGYVIDANMHVHKKNNFIPKIIITLVIDPKSIPHLYANLYARLLDVMTHELNHVDQLNKKGDPFAEDLSNPEERNSSKKNYKYFLLKDEVESMVEGFYARSKELNLSLDDVFINYLSPFLISKYITDQELNKVMEVWVKYALEKYPDANFSNKVKKIIFSL